MMQTYRERLQEAARELADQYDTIKSEAQRRLGTLFNASDHPSMLDGLFDLEVSYPTIEPPNDPMVTPEDILRAASMPSSIPTPDPTPSALIFAHRESSSENEEAVSPACANDTASGVPPRGVERTEGSSEKTAVRNPGDVRSDVGEEESATSASLATSPALSDLAARLAALPPEMIAALQLLFSGLPRQP